MADKTPTFLSKEAMSDYFHAEDARLDSLYGKSDTSKGQKGYMEGSIWYSKAMPKGMGEQTVYNRDEYKLINRGNLSDIDNETMLKVQRKLISLGYLDPGEDDGFKGPRTLGAIKRYNFNTSDDRIWDSMNELKDNFLDFFDGE